MFMSLVWACVGSQEPENPSPDPASTEDYCASISADPATVSSFYEDNPSYTDDTDDLLPTSSPQAAGFDPDALDQALVSYESLNYPWSVLILRNDTLVLERYYHGSDATTSNNVHSASKSILGLLVGIAVDQGDIDGIDQPVADILPELFANLSAKKKTITVGHLLTMTSGIRWTEDDSEYEIENQSDWLAAYLQAPLDHTPGEAFEYSTGSSHLLGAALAEATENSLCAFAHDKLLGPLSAEAEHWGMDPQGHYSGGYSVYLTPRELARFGTLVAAGGVWEDEQIVPTDWVESAQERHTDTGGVWGYGYGFWLWEPTDIQTVIAWGYGGQLVHLVPEHDLIVVTTTNTRDYNPDFDGRSLVRDIVDALEVSAD